ncbi:hypothetical protein [Herminiimonas contaminans]|uniref:Uncharacterized protein n=1 Tax=Herminiimonas contaminans TaxID=1111140 RepID=A0ABS0ESJ0_9BURK|nr:hypothetical protein [Herminiimonas contaminans]MBF8177810.1 hypothetical protein [Herminiimonas contaminans]
MQVIATKKGFDGVKTREVGEEFSYEGELGSWMQETKKDAPAGEQKQSGTSAKSTGSSKK